MPKTQFWGLIAEEGGLSAMVFDAKDGHCLYLNRLAKETLEIEIHDLPDDQPIDFSVTELFPTDELANVSLRSFNAEFLRFEGMNQNVLIKKKNGLPLVANVWLRHFETTNDVKATLVMFEDITLQKKLQRELQAKQDEIRDAYVELLEQNKRLKELDQAKDRFMALTTHELRTPLSAIIAMTDALVLGLEESPEQHREFVCTVHEQALHLMELVNDILDFAKIRAGKMEYFIEQVNILELVKKLTGQFETMAAKSKVTISLEVMGEETVLRSAKAYADPLRLREVIANVMQNAIKYNRPGGVVKFALSSSGEPNGYLRLTVIDTGIGIPDDKLSHVFNEFETVGAISLHHKGTGLGMPISKNLMHGMGGDLTLRSVVNQGSEFFIDIPTGKTLPPEFYRRRPGSDPNDDPSDDPGDFAA